MKHNHIALTISIIGLAALIMILTLTSPTEIGPLGVLLFFTTVYVVSFGVFLLFLGLFYKLAFKKELLRGKDYLYAAVLAFVPIMFLMARSFGASNLWTSSLIIIFTFLAEFLVAKRI